MFDIYASLDYDTAAFVAEAEIAGYNGFAYIAVFPKMYLTGQYRLCGWVFVVARTSLPHMPVAFT